MVPGTSDRPSARQWGELELELAFRARLLNNVPGMVGYWDDQLHNRYANDAYLEWFGLKPNEIRGRHIREVIGERLYALNLPFIEAALRGEPQLFERAITGPDGVTRHSQARYVPDVLDGHVHGFFVLVTDVSPLKEANTELERVRAQLQERVAERTETLARANADLRREINEHEQTMSELSLTRDELHQARKMEAIGRLAGGVAHDFNNLLMVVRGMAGMLLDKLELGSVPATLQNDLRSIDYAALRAEQLTKQLLAFSRKQVLQPRRIDVNELVEGLVPMMRRLIGDRIDVSVALCPMPAVVWFDPGQLEQVLMNLAANARDAMPTGGQLTVSTRRDAKQVVLAVRDTGHGMSPETLTHLFEPFFTTKSLGRGTGLGLATVHGIVSQSGGRIEVESAEGRGTCFELLLPAQDGPPQPIHRTPESAGLRAPLGTETILVVDDEPMVRAFVAATLLDAGYRVLEASGFGDTQRLVARSETPSLDLLLTDVVMPGGSGPQLAAWIKARDPRVKVLYMSGYLALEQIAPDDPLISKPCQTDVILRAVRAVLDAPGTADLQAGMSGR